MGCAAHSGGPLAVSVGPGCCNKIPQPGGLTNNLLLPALEAGSPIGHQPSRGLVRNLLRVADCWLLSVATRGGRKAGELSRAPFPRALILFARTPPQ